MDAPLRIGEVARRTGLTVRTLRHYDDLGLLVPSERSAGDYRLYAEADLRRLLAIQHLKSLGLGLEEIARALDDPDFDPADALARHIAAVEQRLAAERELLRRLRALQGSADWTEVLDTIRLAELLRHPDAGVRLRAALAAPADASVGTLVERLASDPDPGVREVLTWAVARHGAAATPALVARLRDRDPGVRAQVAHALSKLGDRTAVPALAALLADHEPSVAAKAGFALGQLGGEEALDALLDAVGQSEPSVAEGAPSVRDAVTDALARFGPDAVDPVAALLADRHAGVRAHAAEILGMIGDPAAADVVSGALADADADVRFAALVALGQLPGAAATTALRGVLDDPDDRTRILAERLLADRTR